MYLGLRLQLSIWRMHALWTIRRALRRPVGDQELVNETLIFLFHSAKLLHDNGLHDHENDVLGVGRSAVSGRFDQMTGLNLLDEVERIMAAAGDELHRREHAA